ncbi:MAG: DUF2304 domain-containing protein [Clostridiales bacterium]|jgi:hypothetical protein|nr:DUF2304 domain-containing protein [Clostridiales bacterium]
MSIVLRVILIIASLLTILYMMRKIRQSKVQIEDSIFWVIFSVILLIISIFPGLADWLTRLLGIYSTVNFVFLLTIFILLIKLFLMTIKVSQLENKIRELTQRIAVERTVEKEKGDQ